MKRLPRCFSLLLSLALAAAAAGQSTEGRTPLADNAALQYWQAFSQLPTMEKEHETLFSEPTASALAQPAAEKLLDSARQSFVFLDRAVVHQVCDWGLDYNDGVSLYLPHLSKGRDLARLAALDARRSFERGDYKSARKRLLEIMMIGRHMGRDPLLISLLVGSGLEGMAIDAAAPYIPDWKLSYADSVSMLQKLPKAATLEQSVALERKYMAGWIINRLRDDNARGADAWRETWRLLFLGSEKQPPAVESGAAATKLVEELLPVYEELQKYVAMPRDRFEADYPAFKERTKDKNALAGLILPAIDKVREKLQRHEARLAMMLAAVAFVEGGQPKLNEIKDPFGSGPFEYKALDKGFELKSKATFEGQPVTLVVGQRK